jgi:hypothetical protein
MTRPCSCRYQSPMTVHLPNTTSNVQLLYLEQSMFVPGKSAENVYLPGDMFYCSLPPILGELHCPSTSAADCKRGILPKVIDHDYCADIRGQGLTRRTIGGR